MGQVLIVSNRLPVSVKKVDGKLEYSPSLGGLATGLSSYVRDRNNIWIGWPGIASEEVNEREKQQITKELAKHHCRPVFLTRHQIDDYYNGYSNGVLWPVFHNMAIDKSADQTGWWKAYKSVRPTLAASFGSTIINYCFCPSYCATPSRKGKSAFSCTSRSLTHGLSAKFSKPGNC
jgi:trehalose-6-phosphate synthase